MAFTVKTACISALIITAVLLGGCATGDTGAGIDASSLRDQGGSGLRGAYEDALRQGIADTERDRVIGMRKHRFYGLSQPGVPVMIAPETRTYWIAPRHGQNFATHGGWITIIVQKGGFAGAPLRGMYVPDGSLTPTQRVFQAQQVKQQNADNGDSSGSTPSKKVTSELKGLFQK